MADHTGSSHARRTYNPFRRAWDQPVLSEQSIYLIVMTSENVVPSTAF
jgi:hypothetical protein